MQRVEGPQTPYESYCFSCHVTFPVEARQCVHCGGRLARRAPGAESAGLPGLLGGGRGEPEEMPDEEGALFTMRRFGGLLVWTLVAASALLSNLCERS